MTCETFTTAIAYYRVSTAAQGQSGLGLDAQRASVKRYAAQNCLEIAAEFTEIETGTNKRARPQIARAIAAARKHDAVLLIAKLDRLARNVHFISGLMESGVKFVAVDMPTVTNLTLHILAAVAEEEARMISARTRAALAAKRARDGEWRVSQLDDQARLRGAETMRRQAIESMRGVAFTARMLRDSGLSLAAVAEKLNTNGYTTRQGKPFAPMTVKRILDRAPAQV